MSLNESLAQVALPNGTSPTTNASFDLLLLNNDTAHLLSVAPHCTRHTIYRVEATTVVAIKGLLMVAIMLAAILGNLLVIVSVVRFERLRLIANAFIVSLALTDLLVACFVMPFSASKELAARWMYGQLLCDVFNANDVLFSTASLLNLCCISVDRYVAVTDPLRYEERLTVRRVGAMLGFVWVASAVISHLPIHCGWYTTDVQMCIMLELGGDNQCSFEVNQIYGVISSSVSFWIPAIIMVFTYQKIYHEAMKQQKYIQSMTAISSRETSTDRLQYQCADEAVPPHLSRHVDTYRSLEPSLERNLDRNTAERKLDFRNVRHSIAGSLDQFLERRNLKRASCDVQMDPNPERTSLDRQLNRNRSLDGGLDRNLNPSLDRISFNLKLYRNPIQTSYDRHLDRNACQHRRKMRREHKAAKTLGVIMGAFLICWLPFFTWYLTNALCGEACHTPHAVESVLFWVGYLNSALNPIIYALLNRDFRDAFRRLLSCGVRPSPDVAIGATTELRKSATASQDRISMR